MNRKEHLLTIMAEECSEVAVRISKALRFGLNEVQQGQPLTNSERIVREMEDLIGVYQMLQAEHKLPPIAQHMCDQKKKNIERYLGYSKVVGTLSLEIGNSTPPKSDPTMKNPAYEKASANVSAEWDDRN